MARRIENEEVRPLILHDEESGTDYTLEFNRESVKFAESRGFVIDDVDRFPMTKTYELFFYAFRMHHRNVSREKTDKIIDEDWGGIAGIPDGVLERLGMLYAAPFGTLSDGKEDKNPPKVTVQF